MKARVHGSSRPAAPSAAWQMWMSGVTPEAPSVGCADVLREGLGLVGTHQVHRAARPACAGKLAAQEPWRGFGRLDKGIEGLGAVLEVVTARGVRGRDQLAEFGQVAPFRVPRPRGGRGRSR